VGLGLVETFRLQEEVAEPTMEVAAELALSLGMAATEGVVVVVVLVWVMRLLPEAEVVHSGCLLSD
jgi:hypothetical protein